MKTQEADISEPKVLMFDDGRHGAGLYAFEPPLTADDIQLNVDQLVSSGVDAIVYSAVLEGGIAMYDSKVAQRWGDNVQKWTHSVWYRAARNIHHMIDSGRDPLELLVERSHQHGILFFAGSWVNFAGGDRSNDGGLGRKSDFVYDHPEYQVGPEDDQRCVDVSPHRFNFLHPAVRKERFKVFEEMLSGYTTDGIDLDLCSLVPMCKFDEIDDMAPMLTQWLRDMRRVASNAEQEQQLRKRIYIRIPSHPDAWEILGYDVESWVKEGLVDGLVCLPGLMDGPVDQDNPLRDVVSLTDGTGCRAFSGFQNSLGRQRDLYATPPMIWAAAANGFSQGADGFAMVGSLWAPNGWPWTQEEYGTLRLLGHPELLKDADKHYHVRAAAKNAKDYADWLPGVTERLPRSLVEGCPEEILLRVSDDLEEMCQLGKIQSVRLLVRVSNIEASLNDVRIYLNSVELPDDILHLNDVSYRSVREGAVSPYGYIYDYHLTPEFYPGVGQSVVGVNLVRKDPDIEAIFEIHSIDLKIRYRKHRNFGNQPIEY